MREPRRYRVLPDRGTAIVSADLHGNGEDFRRLAEMFTRARAADPETHWVILGDLVHGPCDPARAQHPELYGFADESWTIVEAVTHLRHEHPDHLHLVLGNHDHGHVGGPHSSKFYYDEVQQLESSLTDPQLDAVTRLFGDALLAVAAPCGVLMTHGSPDDSFDDVAQLERLSLVPEENNPRDARLLRTLLTAYGQEPEVTGIMLRHVGASLGFDLNLVLHGHDRNPEGWYAEGHNQLCAVLFGATRENKRYVELDLARLYRDVRDIREGVELLRLYEG